MSQTSVPAELLCAVKRDLQPVRPLVTPARRALSLVPIGIVLLIGMPAFWAWQSNVKLAPTALWGRSGFEIALSLVILAGGFREAVPGRELSTRTIAALAISGSAGFVLFNTSALPAVPVPTDTIMRWIWECIGQTAVFSIPALLVPGWLVSRALPNRPALAGALCGLGIGLMADAGLRLFCWDGGYAHLVVAHGGAIAIVVLLGAISTAMVERLKGK